MKVSENVLSICKFLKDKKAENIFVCDISKISSLADFFIFSTASSAVHAKTLAEFVDTEMNNLGQKLNARDGFNQSNWIVLDFGDEIAHIFTKETREYYNLEKLFNEGNNLRAYEKILSDIKKLNLKTQARQKYLQKKEEKINKKIKNKKEKSIKKVED